MYKLKLFEIITTILKNNLKNANLTDKQIHKMAETIASDLQKRINVRARIMSKKLVLSDNDVEIISKVLGTAPIIKEFVTLFVISGSHKPCICNSLLNEENVHILKSDSGSKAFLFFTNSELTDNQFDVFNKNHPDYSIKRCGERTIEICLMGDSVATLAASAGLVPFLCKVPKNTEEEIYCGSERVQSKTQ